MSVADYCLQRVLVVLSRLYLLNGWQLLVSVQMLGLQIWWITLYGWIYNLVGLVLVVMWCGICLSALDGFI